MSLTHLGKPMAAFSLVYIYTLAGNMAISRAMMPQAANEETEGMQSNMPRIISAAPLRAFSNFGEGRDEGIIFT